MSSREIYNAKGFSEESKPKMKYKKRKKRKSNPLLATQTKKTGLPKKGWPRKFYPEGTNLKILAEFLVEEFRIRKDQKEWEKRNLITTEQYFNRLKRNDYRD